jgi:hypothetical protein
MKKIKNSICYLIKVSTASVEGERGDDSLENFEREL